MKKAMPYLLGEIVLSFLIALFVNGGVHGGFFTTFGLMNLVLGIIGLFSGVIFSIAKQKNISNGLLISSALLLLMGFLTCSAFPMKLN